MSARYDHAVENMRAVCVFCLNHRGTLCFRGWSGAKLFKYVAYHALAGSLFVVHVGGEIKLVAFAWLDDAARIRQCSENCRPVFDWCSRPPGDALYVAEVLGERQWMPWLRQSRAWRWWEQAHTVLTYRRNTLTELRKQTVERITHG